MYRPKHLRLSLTLGIFAVLLPLLTRGQWLLLDETNPDAVSYSMLAQHYLSALRGETRWGLAFSTYWSPLFSWIQVPLLFFTEDQYVTLRSMMFLSGIVYFWGASFCLHLLRLKPFLHFAGLLFTSAFTLFSTVLAVTPDILATGIALLAISVLLKKSDKVLCQWLSGAVFALAYLTKAAFSPIVLVALLLQGLFAYVVAPAHWKSFWRGGLRIVFPSLLVTVLWVTAISSNRGQFMPSSVATINHAITGSHTSAESRGGDSYHPTFLVLHRPEPGRLTSWEDPSVMRYQFWTPWSSLENFKQQLNVILRNIFLERWRWSIGAVILVLSTLALRRGELRACAFCCTGIANLIVYVPFFGYSRFYFLFSTCLVFAAIILLESETLNWYWRNFLASLVVMLALLLHLGEEQDVVSLAKLFPWGSTLEEHTENLSVFLARRLRNLNLGDTIAGGGNLGLIVAFRLGTVYLGSSINCTPEEASALNAEVVFSTRDQKATVGQRFKSSPLYKDITAEVYKGGEARLRDEGVEIFARM